MPLWHWNEVMVVEIHAKATDIILYVSLNNIVIATAMLDLNLVGLKKKEEEVITEIYKQ